MLLLAIQSRQGRYLIAGDHRHRLRFPYRFQSPGGTTADLAALAVLPPGLWDHRCSYPSAIADGSEPPSLPGLLNDSPDSCQTHFFTHYKPQCG